jgi:hypothetical protein
MKMLDWEGGRLTEEESVALFQSLINSGLAWQLQGCYGRQAMAFIEAGLCEPAGRKDEPMRKDGRIGQLCMGICSS